MSEKLETINTQSSTEVERLHYMDAMRATLMMLGVVLHSALVFSPAQAWLVYSENSSPFMDYINVVIHAFRMPAFFVVSGFFCHMTLTRYGASKFLKTRLFRILVPLIATALTLNSIQAYLLTTYGWRPFELSNYIQAGDYISHLWFLTNLVVYFLLAAFLVATIEKTLVKAAEIINLIFDRLPMIILLAGLSLFSVCLLFLNKVGFPLYSEVVGVFNIYELIIYLPYFAFGALLGTNHKLLYKLANFNPLISLVIAVATMYLKVAYKTDSSSLGKLLFNFFHFASAWFSIALCFYLFHRFLNYASKRIYFLSEASYTVYLFHHVLVVAIGMLLIHIGMNHWLGLIILLFSVTAITLFIHAKIVSKVKIFRLLFNGKY